MKLKIYGTYRSEQLTAPEVLPDGTVKNGGYRPAQYLNSQFADWNRAGLTNVIDGDEAISNERYTGTLPVFKDGVPTGESTPKLTRLIIGEYEDAVVEPEAFKTSLANVGAKWDIQPFATVEDARVWVRSNTSLLEDEGRTGTFLISEAHTGMMGEEIPARYLVIE